jgi:hypothetical protein
MNFGSQETSVIVVTFDESQALKALAFERLQSGFSGTQLKLTKNIWFTETWSRQN